MKKITDFDDLIKQLEEALDDVMGEIEIPQDSPLAIDISVNISPYMGAFDGDIEFPHQGGTIPVDILETETHLHVVMGIPDMKKEDFKLECAGVSLEITASNPEKTVHEIVGLPVKVNKTGMKTTYKKEILEVVFNKSKRQGKPAN